MSGIHLQLPELEEPELLGDDGKLLELEPPPPPGLRIGKLDPDAGELLPPLLLLLLLPPLPLLLPFPFPFPFPLEGGRRPKRSPRAELANCGAFCKKDPIRFPPIPTKI